MCGRYNVIDDPFLQALMQSLGISAPMPTMVNIAPTETIPIVVEEEPGEPELRYMRWWLTPSWSDGPSTRYSMFNAKSETLASSRAFRGPFRRHRGVVPASSFIEWRTEAGNKLPWLIHPPDQALAFAAVWDHWEKDDAVVQSCALITRAATPGFSQLHHRMPVILDEQAVPQWLDCSQAIDTDAFFRDNHPPQLQAEPLDRQVNNSRNKDLDLLTPIDKPLRLG